ncbi:MAG: hypothetical protein WD066_00835 [Planctomycetaceae bacterium]
MQHDALSRRDFNRLAMAAFGGALAGTVAGCGDAPRDPVTPTSGTEEPADNQVAAAEPAGGKEPIGGEKPGLHACRGLNQCKNLGKTKQNDCAGQGACFTSNEHSCHTENDCKYLGGCGTTAANNACKGKGECAVPMVDEGIWKQAREVFEKRMAAKGKEVGPAPPKA